MRKWAVALWLASAAAAGQVAVDRSELAGGIAGRVCRDLDGDGACGASEPGVAGARVVLETGDAAIADTQGRYHFALVPSRAPDPSFGGRLLPGRHRVTIDARGLGGDVPSPRAATVEVPMAALVLQDFAVRPPPRSTVELKPAPEEQAPSGILDTEHHKIRFRLSGRGTAGDRVAVQGTPAQVDPRGVYRAWVELERGPNTVAISVQAPSGAVRFFTQGVDVVERSGGFLVIPRQVEPTASLQLPAAGGAKAATGRSILRIEGVPGTRIDGPEGGAVVGPSGFAEVPVELRAGDNKVPLQIQKPGLPPSEERLEISAAPRPLVSALADVEATFNPLRGQVQLFGRGAAHGEYRIGPWELAGELDFRDDDVAAAQAGGAGVLALPRMPERLERAPDPERAPIAWADDAVELSPNPAEGRVRLELRHDDYGRAGYGANREVFADGEVGRFHRELFGAYLDASAPIAALGKVSVKAFAAPGGGDPARGVAAVPAHAELAATGGSLYYLGHGALSEGTELVRVELRDGVTGLPIAERHLVRGRDYEIDYLSGRVLLARPLSFVEGSPLLRSSPLSASPEPWLVVDYERLVLGSAPRSVGGEVTASLGPVSLVLGGADERGGDIAYRLLRARASGSFGPISVHAEGAVSSGDALGPQGPALSDDGGLTFLRSAAQASEGRALSVLLRGPGISPEGRVDAAFRYRSAGFSDQNHAGAIDFRQTSLRAEQPWGPFVIGALVDFRSGADPRLPFEAHRASWRRLGASAGYRAGDLEVRAEVEDAEVTAAVDPGSDALETGGRFAVGASARYRLLPAVSLSLSHRQVIGDPRGTGVGAADDSFSSAGADVEVQPLGKIGVRAGWGRTLGPLAWLQAEHQSGANAFYGAYSVDVDGPDFGQAKAVFGARTSPGDGSTVFVEDSAAHDANAIRLSRAVGLTQKLGRSLSVTAQYERGGRSALGGISSLSRDAGGVTASFVTDWLRLSARAELRRDTGIPDLGPAVAVDRVQRVLSGAAELVATDALRLSGRVNFADTRGLAGLEARLLEGTLAAAWRLDPAMLVARYSIRGELLPPERGTFAERTLHTVSLMPAIHLGPAFMLSAGANAGFSSEAGNDSFVLSGSLRPSFRVVGGLEIAAEVAARTSAPDRGELLAVRGEAGYRFGEGMMLALGYSFYGFTGLGVSADEGRQDRLYLRAELAY